MAPNSYLILMAFTFPFPCNLDFKVNTTCFLFIGGCFGLGRGIEYWYLIMRYLAMFCVGVVVLRNVM